VQTPDQFVSQQAALNPGLFLHRFLARVRDRTGATPMIGYGAGAYIN
jgi:hypothetical protein